MDQTLTATQNPGHKPNDSNTQVELSAIDASLRRALIFFVSSSVIWLLIGTTFALIAAFEITHPDLFPNWEWLTFGRIRSAHLNAVAFGWLNNVIFALATWIMARLSRAPVNHKGILFVAGIVWNLGITGGIIGILTGALTSVEWLEMPKEVAPILALAYALIGVWGALCFKYRRTKHIYISQWYIFVAIFWFPWLYIIGQIMILWLPTQGTVQSITNWWFGHNVLGLWFTPVATATAYYLIPKVLGRPVHSYYLSVVGFWSHALFYNWAGVHHLIGGPIPVWLQSAGIVASVFMVIPVIVTGINHHMTIVGHFNKVWESPTLRFVVFGAMSYTWSSLFGSTMALREVNLITHFTHFTIGHAHHGAYAFVTMIMFGGIYFMMPRILYREWPSAVLIRMHFWFTAIGITLMVLALQVGGWLQGLEMNNPDIPFLETVKNVRPYLIARGVSGILLTIGHIAFFVNFFWMVLGRKRPGQQGPTMIGARSVKGGQA